MSRKVFEMKIFLLILIILFLSGCIEQDQTKGLDIKMMADSDSVFAGSEIKLYLDVNNNDVKTIKNVYMNIFEIGPFTKVSACRKTVSEIKPGSFTSLECKLRAPSTIPISPLTTNFIARVKFDSKLSAVQIVEMITEDEYNIRERTGKLVKMSKTYSYRDKNLELQIDFSDELPIVVRGEKYMYLTIRNIGNGFVSDLKENDITIDEEKNVVNCVKQRISPIEKEFPRIACELNLPEDINYLSNYLIIININYNYELRGELPIDIIR